jgi:5-methylcytosine-specific restriction protein A
MITDNLTREAVQLTLDEFDQLGRDVFLEKYSFGKARAYFVVRDRKRYDSKAIAGVAQKHVTGQALKSTDFGGGEVNVARGLRKLGFEVTASGESQPICDLLLTVAEEFPDARNRLLKDNDTAKFIRDEGPAIFRRIINRQDIRLVGAPGQGNWAEVPWFGFFHPEITDSATRGYYIVYLFRPDMSCVYLSFGQGVTEIREEFKTRAPAEMLRRAELIRDRIPEYRTNFQAGPISLQGSTSLAKDYDTAVSFFKLYDLKSLPSEANLEADLLEMLNLYELLISRGSLDNLQTVIELGPDQSDELEGATIEEKRRYVRHSRIERDSKAAKKAKSVHGYICQGCGFDFERIYGARGRNYIEAHHLTPLFSLPIGKTVSMDPRRDFAVLCSNCHRMVHRTKEPLSLSELQSITGLSVLRNLFRK